MFRGRVIYENWEQFQQAVKDAYALGKTMGYHLGSTFYVTKQAPCIDGKECLTYTVLIPMEL